MTAWGKSAKLFSVYMKVYNSWELSPRLCRRWEQQIFSVGDVYPAFKSSGKNKLSQWQVGT